MLSVIVPVWNNTPALAEMTDRNIARVYDLKSVPTEVIVVDNASPFPGRPMSDVYLRYTTNRGIAPAWNQGARFASNDVLCFMNTDVEVDPGWDTALCNAALNHNVIAMPYTNGVKSDGVGITGWCFAVSRSNFRRIGDFDECFVPAYYEDTDWFHRAIEVGVKLVNVPKANVRHERRTSTNAAPWADRRDLIFMSNRLRYAWKHGVDPNQSPSFWLNPLPNVP